VVIDGRIATVTLNLAIQSGGAAAVAPASITSPSPGPGQQRLQELRETLSSRARTTFESDKVKTRNPRFTNAAAGVVKAVVRVVTQGPAPFSAGAFTTGVTSLETAFADDVCAYIAAAWGSQPVPTVTLTGTSVRLGAGALNATPGQASAGGGTDELTPGEKLAARCISAIGLVLVTGFVLGFLGAVSWTAAVIGSILAAVVVWLSLALAGGA
jgi:hypothetical protein